jgi:hypothetical protein
VSAERERRTPAAAERAARVPVAARGTAMDTPPYGKHVTDYGDPLHFGREFPAG